MNILLIFWIILILLGFLKKDSRFITLIQAVFISWMLATNNGNADQQNYIELYNQLSSNFENIFSSNSNIGGNGNIGFNLILYLSSFLHQYNISLLVIAAFVMIVLYKGIIFYTTNTAIVYSLYLISPFIIDTVQLKNFIGSIVWIYFSRYLYLAINGDKYNRKKNIFCYLIGVMIASSIHFVFTFTLIYIVLVFVNKYNIRKITFNFLVIFVFLLVAIRYVKVIVNILAATRLPIFVTIAGKFQQYGDNFSVGDLIARRYLVIISYVLLFLILLLISKSLKYQVDSKAYSLYSFVLGITLLSMLMLPLMAYSSDIYRVQRDLLLMVYILYAEFSNRRIFVTSDVIRINYVNLTVALTTTCLALLYFYVEDIYWFYNSVFTILFKLQ